MRSQATDDVGAAATVGRPAPSERAALWALGAAVALQAGLLARAPFLPFVDLPQHVALARLFLQRHDPAVAGTYERTLFPQVNDLYMLVLAPLLRLLPEPAAVRFLLVVYLLALAWALRSLARAVGGSAWTAVAGMLLALHFNLAYGFMSYCLGLPILLFLCARLARVPPEDAGRWRAAIVDGLLWLLLALAHVLLLAFGGAALLLRALLAPATARREWRPIAAALPAFGLALLWFRNSQLLVRSLFPETATQLSATRSGLEVIWHGIGAKLGAIGWSTLVADAGGKLAWIVLVALGLAAACLLAAERHAARRTPVAPPDRRRAARSWVRAAALLALGFYVVLPYAVHDRRLPTYGIYLLYHRFLVLVPLLLVPTLRWPERAAWRRALAALLVALHAMSAWSWLGLLGGAAAEARGLDGAIAAIPARKIVKSLIYTPYPVRMRFPAFLHAASYYQARGLGEVDQSFALLPLSPVHYRDPSRPYLSRQDENLRPGSFRWSQALAYDYLLVYDHGGNWLRQYSDPHFRHIYAQNGWTVVDVESARRARARRPAPAEAGPAPR